MERPYRNIVTICFFGTISLMGLLAMQDDRTAFSLVFIGLLVFTILSACYGIFYYFWRNPRSAHKEILIFSACLTAFLFAMDYLFWDKDPPNPPAHRILYESLVYGTVYTGVFFGVFSLMRFAGMKVVQFLQRVFVSKRGM